MSSAKNEAIVVFEKLIFSKRGGFHLSATTLTIIHQQKLDKSPLKVDPQLDKYVPHCVCTNVQHSEQTAC